MSNHNDDALIEAIGRLEAALVRLDASLSKATEAVNSMGASVNDLVVVMSTLEEEPIEGEDSLMEDFFSKPRH